MLDLKSIFSKKISLAIIAILIGLAAIAYNLRGRNILLPQRSTIQAKDQNNSGLKIYKDTITVKDTVVNTEWFPDRKLPI